MTQPVVYLLGPTASGKSGAALWLAERFPLEIVSVDSALIYRGMDIGTAKPSAAERALVPHHLIDILEPEEAYSAARFVADARQAISAIQARGRIPLLTGGTMLYFKALRDGLDDLPAADERVRLELEAEAARRGWPGLYAELAQVDPETAARLAPTDAQRIQRALEVWRVSGRPLSSFFARTTTAAPGVLELGLEPSDRAVLHERIAARFDAMLAHGLIEEVENLRQRPGINPRLPSMRAVGYRQVWAYLDRTIDREELRAQGIAATRQLAKRQITWLRQFPKREVVDALAPEAWSTLARHIDRARRERSGGTGDPS